MNALCVTKFVHRAFAEDAISPKDWNVKSGMYGIEVEYNPTYIFIGGKQQKSRPGYFYNSSGEKVIQHFIFQDGPLMGQAKGLKVSYNTHKLFHTFAS